MRKVVGDEQNRAALCQHLHQHAFHRRHACRIQPGCRLIQKQRPGPQQKRPGQGQALAFAGGKARDLPIQRRLRQGQAREEGAGRLRVRKMRGDALRPPAGIRRQITDFSPPFRGRQAFPGAAVQGNPALIWVQIGDGAQKQGLSRAAWPYDGDAFAIGDFGVDRGQVPCLQGFDAEHFLVVANCAFGVTVSGGPFHAPEREVGFWRPGCDRNARKPLDDFATAFALAFEMIGALDADLVEIVGLSLKVSLTAVGIAALIGLPLGAAVALFRFPGAGLLTIILNAMMGLPPVVVGLVVYLLISRAGPLGVLELLFTPAAMIFAQVLLVMPIIAALTRQVVIDLWEEYDELLLSLGIGRGRAIGTLLWDGRFRVLSVVLAGLGRAMAEVGAVMIVGGNINHVTRVMTTTIALETSKGNLTLALGLGIILLALSLLINGAIHVASVEAARRSAG